MTQLDARKRARLPKSAFAYVDSQGRKRLPIHDEAHVRNALARFKRTSFEDEAAKERARTKLLAAAKKYGIVPIGFMTGQLRSQRTEAAAGRLFIELERIATPTELEQRLRAVFRDPSLAVLTWSESGAAYVDGKGQPAALPDEGGGRAVTLLERHGRPMTAFVHDPVVLEDPDLMKTVLAAVRLSIENERLNSEVEVRATELSTLPSGSVTFMLTDIEDSTGLIRRLGDRYALLLVEVRRILRSSVRRSGGREVDARADEYFCVFQRAAAALEAAIAVQSAIRERTWAEGVEVRLRIGIHSGRPTLTDTGYVGLTVHAAARVCAAAQGDQILLSAAARAAVEKPHPTGTRFRSLGLHQLRGLPEPVELFEAG